MRRRFNPFRAIANHLKSTLGAGIVVMLPIGITAFVFKFIFGLLDPPLRPIFQRWLPGYDATGLGLAALVVLVYLAGLIAALPVGRRLVQLLHHILETIPVIKNVYGTARGAVELIGTDTNHQPYSRVVLVGFPSPPLKSIGLVTANLRGEGGEDMLAVLIPTPPTPSTGYLILVAARDTVPIQMNVDDAMKIIISCGIMAKDIPIPMPSTKGASTSGNHLATGKVS